MGDFNAQVGAGRNGYENIIGKFGEGTRNQEGENILDMCNRNQWMIGNGWFKKRKSHKITTYSWDRKSETIIDYFVMSRNVWTVVTDIKVIPSKSLEGDHRLLVADFRNIKGKKPIIYQEKKKLRYGN
jgi:hypothetical protein